MRSIAPQGQLILFPGADTRPGGPARAPRPTRTQRKAEQLDRIAEQAEREMTESFRAGDAVSAKAAHDRARGARRAAQLLRAGPDGVAEVLGGHSTAA